MIAPYMVQAIQCLRSVVSMACGQASGIRNADVRANSSSGIAAAFSKKARPNSTQRPAKTAFRIRPPRMYRTCWSTAMASASWMGADWMPTAHQLRSASAIGREQEHPERDQQRMRSPHSVRSARSSASPASACSSTSVPAHRPQS